MDHENEALSKLIDQIYLNMQDANFEAPIPIAALLHAAVGDGIERLVVAATRSGASATWSVVACTHELLATVTGTVEGAVSPDASVCVQPLRALRWLAMDGVSLADSTNHQWKSRARWQFDFEGGEPLILDTRDVDWAKEREAIESMALFLRERLGAGSRYE